MQVSPVSSGNIRIRHAAWPSTENNQEKGFSQLLHTQIYLGDPELAQKRGSSLLRPICKSTDGRCRGKKASAMLREAPLTTSRHPAMLKERFPNVRIKVEKACPRRDHKAAVSSSVSEPKSFAWWATQK